MMPYNFIVYGIVVLVAFFSTLFVTPLVRFFGLKIKAIDYPNYRKIHSKVITKLGGLSIFCGFIAGLIVSLIFAPDVVKPHIQQICILCGCVTLALGIGAYDDLVNSRPIVKLFAQLLIAVLMVKNGYFVSDVYFTKSMHIFLPTPIDIIISVLWHVMVFNSINFIDGVDGLAAGLASIIAFFLGIYGVIIHETFFSILAFSLLGATLAFLKNNFYPAKIFMGDCGSLLIGCILSSLVTFRFPGPVHNNYILPFGILVMMVPIADVCFAVLRRTWRGKHIFASDSAHIHHRMLRKGYNQVQTVLCLYIATMILGLIGLMLLKWVIF